MDIRVDWDIGFSEDRQYGRGKSGGQVRDEHRRGEEDHEMYPKYGNGGSRNYSMDKMIRRREPYEVGTGDCREEIIEMEENQGKSTRCKHLEFTTSR